MTLFEILYFNRELIKRLQSAGVKFGDCRYIELYIEYMIILLSAKLLGKIQI